MTNFGITRTQRDLLAFIEARLEQNEGIPPSFDEMAAHLGLKSKSGVHRLLQSLEERGMIRRLPNRARSIALPSSDVVLSPELSAALRRQYGRQDRIEAFIRQAVVDAPSRASP